MIKKETMIVTEKKWTHWTDLNGSIDDMQSMKFTITINGVAVVVSNVVCRYLKQVTIKCRVQITKWYLKVILSRMYFLLTIFDVHAVDEYSKWMHRCSNHWLHHHHHRYALYTIAHFYLQCRPRWNHHSVNYFPN